MANPKLFNTLHTHPITVFLSDDAIRVPIIDWKSLVRKSSTFRLSLTPPFLDFLFPYSVERVRAAPIV